MWNYFYFSYTVDIIWLSIVSKLSNSQKFYTSIFSFKMVLSKHLWGYGDFCSFVENQIFLLENVFMFSLCVSVLKFHCLCVCICMCAHMCVSSSHSFSVSLRFYRICTHFLGLFFLCFETYSLPNRKVL